MYVKTLGKIMLLYILGDVAACRRVACVLCAVQNETHSVDFKMHGATIKTTTYSSSLFLVLSFEDQ